MKMKLGIGLWMLAILYFVSGNLTSGAEWVAYLIGVAGVGVYVRFSD